MATDPASNKKTPLLYKCSSHGRSRSPTCVVILVALLMELVLTMEGATVFSGPSSPTLNSVVSDACKQTLYPQTCLASLTSHVATSNMAPMAIFDHSVQVAINEAQAARGASYKFKLSGKKPPAAGGVALTGMDDCAELLDDSLAQLADVLNANKNRLSDDVRTWLSAAMTYQGTCVESLAGVAAAGERAEMIARANNVSEIISNSLALFHYAQGGRSPSSAATAAGDNFPAWMSPRERRLLEASPEEMEGRLVVAKDGSGTHRTIAEALVAALAAAPAGESGGGGRTVIHVTAGTYKENVKIPKGQKNVLLVGDGKGKTVITSDRSKEGGWTTFQSATFGEPIF